LNSLVKKDMPAWGRVYPQDMVIAEKGEKYEKS